MDVPTARRVGRSRFAGRVVSAPFTQAEVDAINIAQWEGQAQWASGVPDAVVITIPDTTHYVQNQRPEVVVGAIRGAR